MKNNVSDKKFEMFSHFKSVQCCDYCSLRMTGETSTQNFLSISNTLKLKGYIPDNGPEPSSKVQKKNPCVGCLGLLEPQFFENLIQRVSEEIVSSNYDNDTFNIAITLPVNFQLRAHSLWVHLVDRFPDVWRSVFPLGCVTVTVKDLVKWVFTPKIEQKTNKRFNPKSDFSVNVFVTHGDNDKESSFLYKILPGRFTSKRGDVSRKAVEEALQTVNNEDFSADFPCPPTVPDYPAKLQSVSLSHASIYVAGRYLKLSRKLPQTPWILAGERKMEGSVQEFICQPIEEAFFASGSKFGASGREDVDVRMLGRGRPFCVELLNPHKTKASPDEMRLVEKKINELAQENVFIHHLQIVHKSCVIDLKEGEEHKIKVYEALCIVFGDYDLSLIKCPIELSQVTPIRVLHRRPLAIRPRTVHDVQITPLNRPEEREGCKYVKVKLKTQAGTYVKEFVHGDLGRTNPSLASIIKAKAMDILSLDVKDIELDWPPPVDYS